VVEAGAELVRQTDNMGHNYKAVEGTYVAGVVDLTFHILELGQAE